MARKYYTHLIRVRNTNKRFLYEFLTEKRRTNVFGYLISGFTGLGKVTELFVKHPFEL